MKRDFFFAAISCLLKRQNSINNDKANQRFNDFQHVISAVFQKRKDVLMIYIDNFS